VQYLEDRIYEFNSSETDIADGDLLAFFVRDRDRILAGICGNTWGGTCEVRQFWVDMSQRRRPDARTSSPSESCCSRILTWPSRPD